jgi:uridine phosphorylase
MGNIDIDLNEIRRNGVDWIDWLRVGTVGGLF